MAVNKLNYLNEIEQEYKKDTGNDFSFLSNNNIPKSEITSLMLLYDNCKYNVNETINFFLGDTYLKRLDIAEQMNPYLKEFFGYYEGHIFGNKDKIDFINKAAHVYLDNYRNNEVTENNKVDPLYKFSKPGAKFVDLASGFNFTHFYDEMDSNTEYFLVDKSMIACECLRIKAKEKSLCNVNIINKDIADIAEDIGNVDVIRANNIWCYVNDFQKYIPELKKLINKNGVFVFQEYSVNKILSIANNPYGTWLGTYFADNWRYMFTVRNIENIRAFDTFEYTKI